MKLKLFTILILAFSGVGGAFAQTSAPVIKDNTNPVADEIYRIGDVRGNIKRKAIYLPKPRYPLEALEAGADGEVKVEIVLGADGKVISAKAIAGHPLLYAATEETALKTAFRRSETAAPNENGVIIYSFAIEKDGWMKIGYALSAIQKISTLSPIAIPRIARAFETVWTEERAMLARLAAMRRAELEASNDAPANADPNGSRPVLTRSPLPSPNGAPQSVIKSELRVRLPMPNPPSPEQVALAQNLSASLQSRLASDELNLWHFNTGDAIVKASALMRQPNEGRNAAQILRQALETAPAGVADETRAALQSLIEIFESDRRNVETYDEIRKRLTILFSDK